MNEPKEKLTRRDFVASSARTFVGATAVSMLGSDLVHAAMPAKKRVALVGTGGRGTSMWGRQLLAEQGDRVEMVGLCDINPKRVEAGKRVIGTTAPTFTNLGRMLNETKPDILIVTTKDSTHHEQIVEAMKFGIDVISEKPMTTTAEKCQLILDTEKKTGKKLTVAFNYRFSPRAEKIKELLMSGAIGEVTSMDFSWYLDTRHGADYFRRWHAYKDSSGSLFVHKATHHFDLVNWYLEADPVEVRAMGQLRTYGRNGTFRGRNCRDCEHKTRCPYYFDITRNPGMVALYVECESADGYLRDACVFRENIDIYDTMAAQVRYSNGVMLSYSVNAFMPYEGHTMSFNGMKGRIDVRSYERQPWDPGKREEIRLTQNFTNKSEIVDVTTVAGGHGGGDPRMMKMIFDPSVPDPYRQRAGSRAGAMSTLTGVAAVKSVETGKPVMIGDLVKF